MTRARVCMMCVQHVRRSQSRPDLASRFIDDQPMQLNAGCRCHFLIAFAAAVIAAVVACGLLSVAVAVVCGRGPSTILHNRENCGFVYVVCVRLPIW